LGIDVTRRRLFAIAGIFWYTAARLEILNDPPEGPTDEQMDARSQD